ICPSSTGHLHTMLPLGQELKRRGHRVTLVGILDSQEKTLAAGLEFQVIGESDYPLGATKDLYTQLGKLSGLKALQYTIEQLVGAAELMLKEVPAAIKIAGIEALLIDQAFATGKTIAQYLDIPFVSIASALVLNQEITVPPLFTSWNYDPSWRGILRNSLGYALFAQIGKPVAKVIQSYRQQWSLPPINSPNDVYSQLAQISQQPAEFEFPRRDLPGYFHFTGPYHYSGTRQPTSFPYKLNTIFNLY
ncbi:MAG: glycosyl transferase family 1, partial [Cyanobacteria bacterium J06558_2]